MTTIIIFDLDDTLVNWNRKIPRQTYHMLNKFKKLNYIIGVISYNLTSYYIAEETNLYEYTSHIFYKNTNRDILFELCINKIITDYNLNNITNIYYIDDRIDNLQVVKNKYPNVITYHCYNIYELYKLKYSLRSK